MRVEEIMDIYIYIHTWCEFNIGVICYAIVKGRAFVHRAILKGRPFVHVACIKYTTLKGRPFLHAACIILYLLPKKKKKNRLHIDQYDRRSHQES